MLFATETLHGDYNYVLVFWFYSLWFTHFTALHTQSWIYKQRLLYMSDWEQKTELASWLKNAKGQRNLM